MQRLCLHLTKRKHKWVKDYMIKFWVRWSLFSTNESVWPVHRVRPWQDLASNKGNYTLAHVGKRGNVYNGKWTKIRETTSELLKNYNKH